MKKLICIILGLFLFTCSYGQAIINRSGPANTVQDARWMSQYNAFLPRYNDTTAANLQKGIDSCGAIIFTYDIAALWFRSCSNGSKQWVQILPAGSPTPGGQAWINPGNSNLFTDASLNGGFGTLGNNGVYFKTNGITRLYLDRNGIAPETGTSVGIGIDPADSNRITYFSGGGGSTPTWQQTLTAGSTLNTDNTVDGGGNTFNFVNNNILQFGATSSGAGSLINIAQNSNGGSVTSNIVLNDSISLTTSTGKYYLSGGILNVASQNNLLGIVTSTGQAGRITIGSGLSLSNGVLSSTVTAGANTALSNLASVAINTSLLPGTDDGAALGSTSKEFSDLFLASGGVINWANGNTTLTQTSGSLTLGGAFYATSSVAAGTYLYGGDKYNTYTGYTGAVLGGITTHAVLDFVDNNSRIGEFYTDASNFNFFTDVSKGIVFYVNNSFTAPALQFSSAGALRLGYLGAGALTADASGNITSVSDERLKNIEGGYGVGLSQVYKINPIVYKWKPETKLDSLNSYIGFSAQNIEYALGENAVGINRDGYKSIQDRAILAALTNSIKELKDLNDSQQKEIDDLKKEVKKLKRL